MKKDLTGHQMFVSRQTTSQLPPPKILPIYISWYINDYRRPWTSSDVNQGSDTFTGELQVAKGCCFRLQIKWSAATFPRPLKYPRRGDGRKGAFGVAMRWRQRHPLPRPCPRHHDEHRGQERERGRSRVGLGKERTRKSVPSTCPTGESPAVFHG
jgi:hypothetical protein